MWAAPDRLAALEQDSLAGQDKAAAYRKQAEAIRTQIVDDPAAREDDWADATLGEAFFGLDRFDEAQEHLSVACDPSPTSSSHWTKTRR